MSLGPMCGPNSACKTPVPKRRDAPMPCADARVAISYDVHDTAPFQYVVTPAPTKFLCSLFHDALSTEHQAEYLNQMQAPTDILYYSTAYKFHPLLLSTEGDPETSITHRTIQHHNP